MNMLDVRKSDPTFTNFVPRTAAEAVDRFVRCRNNGLKAMLIPECLIACAKGLTGKELDMFEAWVINPNGTIPTDNLVEQREIREANDAVFEQNLERIERMNIDEEPPLPAEDDDVSMQDVDDEKMMPVSER